MMEGLCLVRRTSGDSGGFSFLGCRGGVRSWQIAGGENGRALRAREAGSSLRSE
jgi:hypothetical protein